MRKLVIVRRVEGSSMLPMLKQGQLVIASSLIKPRVGRIIVAHYKGQEVIKRIALIRGGQLYLEGDNSHKAHNVRVARKDVIATKI